MSNFATMLVVCVFVLLCLKNAEAISDDSVKRERVSTKCEEKFSRIPKHSACLPASTKVKKSGVTEEDKKIILREHNRYRSNVNPTAADMMRMSWDDEIAFVAQRYADACKVLIHDGRLQRSIPGRFSCGQNLAAASIAIGFARSIKMWYNEVKKFKVEGNNKLHIVGHYTQVVWSWSSKIGCGYAHCGNQHNYVCNYGPGGNSDVDNPYKRGSPCADCPGHCKDNLCDCDGLLCLNQASMNLTTCTCNCQPEPFYTGKDCHMNCTGREDPYPCGTGFTPDKCEKYSNVPQICPVMCGICPYAGVDYGKDDDNTDDGEDDKADKTNDDSKSNKNTGSSGTAPSDDNGDDVESNLNSGGNTQPDLSSNGKGKEVVNGKGTVSPKATTLKPNKSTTKKTGSGVNNDRTGSDVDGNDGDSDTGDNVDGEAAGNNRDNGDQNEADDNIQDNDDTNDRDNDSLDEVDGNEGNVGMHTDQMTGKNRSNPAPSKSDFVVIAYSVINLIFYFYRL